MVTTLKSARRRRPDSGELTIRLTHPDRVIFTDLDVTKRDLAVYYARVATSMLPHLTGRPLALMRCPAGTQGQCFFQKHPPAGLPAAVKRIAFREKRKDAVYVQIDDVEGLVSLVQHGAIEFHVWGSRSNQLEKPDRLVFDLDPDPDVGWKEVIRAAMELHDELDDLKLTSFVKTTGGKGLHVVVPIQPEHEWPAVKEFCRALAAGLASALGDISEAVRPGGLVAVLENDTLHQLLLPWPPQLELAVRSAEFASLQDDQEAPEKFYVARGLAEMFVDAGLEPLHVEFQCSTRRPPFGKHLQAFVDSYLQRLAQRVAGRLNPKLAREFARLTESDSDSYLLHQPAATVGWLNTVVWGRKPAAN